METKEYCVSYSGTRLGYIHAKNDRQAFIDAIFLFLRRNERYSLCTDLVDEKFLYIREIKVDKNGKDTLNREIFAQPLDDVEVH
ncbi:MAG: hypothetical protein MN733_41560 [Nitrososphaera sp.]|nr:hypothetical protein [Nitrososphaera sp.]